MPATNTPAARLRGPYTDVPTHFARSPGVIGCGGTSCAPTAVGAPRSVITVESAAKNFIEGSASAAARRRHEDAARIGTKRAALSAAAARTEGALRLITLTAAARPLSGREPASLLPLAAASTTAD